MKILDRQNYSKALSAIQNVAINHFFALSVLKKHVGGEVFVNDFENPETFYVKHPYGMSLLFGESKNSAFNNALKTYLLKPKKEFEWLQAYPASWDTVLDNLLEGNISPIENEKHVWLQSRVNFMFEKQNDFVQIDQFELVKVNQEIFENFDGSVVPKAFWNNAKDFLKNGIGFCLTSNGEPVSIAFSSFVHNKNLEIGIETKKEFQGNGLASLASKTLISYCLENGYEPIWACRLGNLGSYKLALKVGFVPKIEIPYYRI